MSVSDRNRKLRVRGTTRGIDEAAARLRHERTPAEQKLWNALRNRQLGGLKFRSQYPIGSFVLDFCCPERRLVIEVDGEIHREQQERDQARTEVLEAHGYTILRICNDEILSEDLRPTLARILQTANQQKP
ncbi:MAG: endonuclease domain-containing protein [Armatimonadetes bacterium]|nr:endonuclease domain-containing protein [Armatimonadota bacterium]